MRNQSFSRKFRRQ